MKTTAKAPIKLSIDDFKKISSFMYDKKEDKKIKQRWIEKLMNKFGWHRRYTIIVIDENKLTSQFWLEKQLTNLRQRK